MSGELARLSGQQRRAMGEWFPDAVVEHDHSWGLTGMVVLEIRSRGRRFIVKAAPPGDKHLARELTAHGEWVGVWQDLGRAPRLAYADPEAGILATEFVPGHLVLGSPAAEDPEAYRQAGELLRRLHDQTTVVDATYESEANATMLRWLGTPNRIDASVVAQVCRLADSWPTPPTTVVPTHGDWQPRNWLWSDGILVPIDFGRMALRPAVTDLARLDVQEFRQDPALADAFFEGYGPDPRGSDAWFRIRMREAVGTAVWAYLHDDEAFEQQGHAMLADVLAELDDGAGHAMDHHRASE